MSPPPIPAIMRAPSPGEPPQESTVAKAAGSTNAAAGNAAREAIIGCFGLTEPHGGSDPANMKTHAKKRGGDWVLNGSKMWITNGSLADLAVVWAMTPEGIRGFLIEKGTPGFSAPEIEHKFS